ncbi:hypothetical protein NRL14_14290 [Pseudoalteromonas sp. 20-92]|uniref:hypothetical protein n=1 Tax=Pseudoalteromonas sp. 20-92 TaxID=2969394 RepID=UPI0027B77396|nr:hypothetical protein [Pseudoalteromonas sp. 20-92]MDQ2044903.1 hypothetical protein [Pseudoalteromonas sp. 20-92]
MLSNYLSNYEAQLLVISNAQLCPFTSVGHVKTLKKRLLELCWLNAKRNNLSQVFVKPNLEQLIAFQESGQTHNSISQACIEIMANLPQTVNIKFINCVLNEPELHAVAKLIIRKVLLQQHSLNLVPLIDISTLFLAYSTEDKISDQALSAIEEILFVTSKSNTKELINIFDNLTKNGLVNSPLMSLFLLSLSLEQVNVVSNYASNIVSVDHTLQVLLQSGFVKLIPLANTVLHQVKKPEQIVALIKRILGEKLDVLVNFETQMQARNGNEQACLDFQRQLQANWPSYESQMSSLRLLAGRTLNEPLNAIEMSAMDCQSQAVFNLYTYYQSVAARKENSGTLL